MVDLIVTVAIAFHFVELIVCAMAANFTYSYARLSEKYFIAKQSLPFFTVGMASLGAAAALDIFFLVAGADMRLSIGLFLRLFALVYLLLGVKKLYGTLDQTG